MKVIILAGGLGTRISEETDDKPKPMVLIDDKPILWHVMNVYASQGFTDFVIATGYKGVIIHEWVKTHTSGWNIEAFDTGLNTQTGGRIKLCIDAFPSERYFATYGDGLGNINVNSLLQFHKQQGRLATVTAVRPPARFGVLESSNGVVTHFGEKNQTDSGWINGGFFVLEPSVGGYIKDVSHPFESHALADLVSIEQLAAFHHNGYWQPMDTLREKRELQKASAQIIPPWLDFV